MNIRAKIFGGASEPVQPILPSKTPKGAKTDELHSVTVARQEGRRCNNRSDDRHRLAAEKARVSYCGAEHEVALINLSGGGAMISASFEPMLWDKVELHLGPNGTIECAVRWIRDGRVGLEFAHETRLDCPADEQAMLLREVILRSFPDVIFEPAKTEDDTAAPNVNDDEQRNSARHPLIWSGVLHHDYQTTPVRVRNISSTGAMIESKVPVRVGAEPLLELSPTATISGTVEWAVGDQYGVSFHNEFDMSLLAASRPEVAPAKWLRPAYLDPEESDSPWDPQWDRLSISELKQELEGFLKR